MAAKYKVIEKVNPSDLEAPRKFYPSLQTNGRVNQRTLATEAADRSSMSDADMACNQGTALTPAIMATKDMGAEGQSRTDI